LFTNSISNEAYFKMNGKRNVWQKEEISRLGPSGLEQGQKNMN